MAHLHERRLVKLFSQARCVIHRYPNNCFPVTTEQNYPVLEKEVPGAVPLMSRMPLSLDYCLLCVPSMSRNAPVM